VRSQALKTAATSSGQGSGAPGSNLGCGSSGTKTTTPSSPGAGSSDGGAGGGNGQANVCTGGSGDGGNGFGSLRGMAGVLITRDVLQHEDQFKDSIEVVAHANLKETLIKLTKDHTAQHPDGAVVFMTDAAAQLFSTGSSGLSGAGSIAVDLAWKVGGIEKMICMVSEQTLLSTRWSWA